MSQLVCTHCLTEAYLRDQATDNDVSECDYCDRELPVMDMDELVDMCETAIHACFRPIQQPSSVIHHGYPPVGESLYFVLERMLGAGQSLLSDVHDRLLEAWSGLDDDDDPYFIEETEASSELTVGWRKMEHSLQFESRLANPLVGSILSMVFDGIEDLRSKDDRSAIVIAGVGQPISSFQRGRVFQDEDTMAAALKHPEKHLGPLPRGKGSPGRMNAKGISVFYGATDDHTAIAEVRPPVGSTVVTARFDVIRPLRLLNLNDLNAMRPHRDLSYFNPVRRSLAERCAFLKALQSQLTMPVMPDSAESGYLITQAIADFLATHQGLNLDGILFPSAQVPKDASPGQNVILFHKASGVERLEDTQEAEYVSLWESDEDRWVYYPEFWEAGPRSRDERSQYVPLVPHPEPSLRLARDCIVIHQIQGVRFSSAVDPVRYVPWSKDRKFTGFR
ncbi:RES family NAD+ phosphorylase [Pseudomonas tremae]|uniref:RES family NAD+ phosphorylase n=1 Tax=Pseudomonas tremae TaxID=200454 RepID=UPI00041CFCA7|nr:RES family NAD+ phosphorylase [Pseudomonas tremae]